MKQYNEKKRMQMHNKLIHARDIINIILEQEDHIHLYAGTKVLYFTTNRDFYCEVENDCLVFYDYNHLKTMVIDPEEERIIRIYGSEIYHITITDVENEAISITL